MLNGNDDIPPENTGVDTIGDPTETTGVELAVAMHDDAHGPNEDPTEWNVGDTICGGITITCIITLKLSQHHNSGDRPMQ